MGRSINGPVGKLEKRACPYRDDDEGEGAPNYHGSDLNDRQQRGVPFVRAPIQDAGIAVGGAFHQLLFIFPAFSLQRAQVIWS